MSEANYEITRCFGRKQLFQFYRMEGNRMQAYGYSITYDSDGVEVSSTEPYKLGALVWDEAPQRKRWQFWRSKT